MARRIGAEARQVDDGEFGLEAVKLGSLRADEERADEVAVPGELGDHPHAHAMLGLRAAVQVLDVERLLVREGGEEIRLQRREMVRGHRLVVVPPDRAVGFGVADDELVVGRAAGMLAGPDHQRPVLCEQALAARDGVLDQGRRAEIPVQGGGRVDALVRQIERRHSGRHLYSPKLHGSGPGEGAHFMPRPYRSGAYSSKGSAVGRPWLKPARGPNSMNVIPHLIRDP